MGKRARRKKVPDVVVSNSPQSYNEAYIPHCSNLTTVECLFFHSKWRKVFLLFLLDQWFKPTSFRMDCWLSTRLPLACLHNHHSAGQRKAKQSNKNQSNALRRQKKVGTSGRNQDGNFSQLLACRLIIRGEEEEKHLRRSSVKRKTFQVCRCSRTIVAADLFSVRCVNQRKESICHRFFPYRVANWLVCTKRNELRRLFFVILPVAKHTLH